MLNSVCLIGRLVADPELKYTQSGTALANFRLAVDRERKDAEGKRETDFIDCVAFGKTAEFVAQYLKKGRLASVDGRLQVRNYTTNDGAKRLAFEVIAESVQGLDRAPDAAPTAQASPVQTPAQLLKGEPAGTTPQNGPQTFAVEKITPRTASNGNTYFFVYGPGHETGELMFPDALTGTGIGIPDGEIAVSGFVAVLESWKNKMKVKELINADAPVDTSAAAFDEADLDPFGD